MVGIVRHNGGVTTSDSGSFDDAAFEDRTTAEQVGLDDDEGSPRPPTRVPGVWKQMPMAVRILMVALLLVAVGGIWALSRQSLASSSNLAGGTIVRAHPHRRLEHPPAGPDRHRVEDRVPARS